LKGNYFLLYASQIVLKRNFMKKIFSFLFLILAIPFSANASCERVVCIPGFLGDVKDMARMQRAVECIGFKGCIWDYDGRRNLICEHAKKLVATLITISCEDPGRPIHFVAQSMGGLILRAALNDPCCPVEAKIGRAVLLAPPNQGSMLGRQFQSWRIVRFVLGSKSGWELLTYTADDIHQLGSFPPEMDILVVAGTKRTRNRFLNLAIPNDGIVAVEETYLETPFYFATVPINHFTLPTSVEAIEIAQNFLLCGN
jgi:hypothetical protein